MRSAFLVASASLMLLFLGTHSMAQVAAEPEAIGDGPDFFLVEGIADTDLLNIRISASPTGKLVGRLPNATALRNLGCSEVNGAQWCKVQSIEDPGIVGWAAARYLRETVLEGVSTEPAMEAGAGAAQPAVFDAIGEIPCSRYYGKPMSMCAATVKRGGKGEATVTVTWPDGGERVIRFQNGRADTSDAAEPVSWTREAELNMIRIGKDERFEIPDTFPFGG